MMFSTPESIAEREKQLADFLAIYPYEKAMQMTLNDYSGIASENDNYFCRWVEQKASELGGIRGGSAYKFGIYQIGTDKKTAKNAFSENGYSWLRNVGDNFDSVKKKILTNIKKVIEAAHNGDYEAIDGIDGFFDTFKWKVAFLYSDKKLVPIYKQDALRYIVKKNGMPNWEKAKFSEIYRFLIALRGEQDVWSFGAEQWNRWKEYDNRTHYFIARLSYANRIKEALEKNVWILQQRYSIQDSATVSRVFNAIKKIRPDDILLLTYGNKILAAGRAKTFNESLSQHQSKLSKVTNCKSHEYFDFSGTTYFSDCPAYYEVLSENCDKEDSWGQYVGVENWNFYNENSNVRTTGLKCKVKNSTVQNTIFEVESEWGKQKYEELENNDPGDGTEPDSAEDDMDQLTTLLLKKKNMILQGAPGTGKTFETASLALKVLGDNVDFDDREAVMKQYHLREKEGRISFVTFHQTMDYESFVEGLKAVAVKDKDGNAVGGVSYEPKPGVFKNICDRARTKKDESFESCFAKYLESIKSFDNKRTISTTSGESEIYVWYEGTKTIQVRSTTSAIPKPESATALLNIEKIINQANDDLDHGENNWPQYANAIIADVRKEYPSKTDAEKLPYVLIIDEINRGNVSKIFGELITLLEPDKREGALNEVSTTLTYSQLPFTVPSNLYIIGTMNTTDRSVGSVDYAIRRRFAFKPLVADSSVIEKFDKFENSNVHDQALDLFNAVKKFLDKNKVDMNIDDMMVGHSYFLAETQEDLDMKWNYEILPLLQEYFKDGIINTEPKVGTIQDFIASIPVAK